MKSTAEVVKIKDAFAWIDNERGSDEAAIALRAITRDNKPVLLSAADTRRLADRLAKLADVLESLVEQARERSEPDEPAEG